MTRTTIPSHLVDNFNENIKNHKNSFKLINPYRQIPETISKKRAVTQGIFRKLFPGKFHEYP